MSQIERIMFREVLSVKAGTDSAIASGFPSDASLKLAVDTFSKFMGLTLPYMAKDPKLDTGITKERMAEWKATLKALKDDRDKRSKKKK